MTEFGSIREIIRDQALGLGFDAVGFAGCDAADAGENLAAYLARGYHGDMGWMESTRDRRRSPSALWPEARSVIVVGMNYGPEGDPLEVLGERGRGAISVYAGGRDYHDVMKKRLRRLARWLVETRRCEVKLFVDTAPVMEKPVAQRAGLGWQGKHTNLVSRRFGSWLFLGEIFTTLDISPGPGGADHCGSCRRCLDVCPTAAFPAPYQLDATRCISYLTIEHKGHIAREFRVPMGNRIYGCDDCLAVCPWNRFASATAHGEFHPRGAAARPLLEEFCALDDAGFRTTFSGSPVKRLGRDRFVRNVLIAVGNSGMPSLASSAKPLLGDPSPLVRAMAVWALSRLLPREGFRALRRRHMAAEEDQDVRAEWESGCRTG